VHTHRCTNKHHTYSPREDNITLGVAIGSVTGTQCPRAEGEEGRTQAHQEIAHLHCVPRVPGKLLMQVVALVHPALHVGVLGQPLGTYVQGFAPEIKQLGSDLPGGSIKA